MYWWSFLQLLISAWVFSGPQLHKGIWESSSACLLNWHNDCRSAQMPRLEEKLELELKDDARVIACRFPFPRWTPDHVTGEGVDTVWAYDLRTLRGRRPWRPSSWLRKRRPYREWFPRGGVFSLVEMYGCVFSKEYFSTVWNEKPLLCLTSGKQTEVQNSR